MQMSIDQKGQELQYNFVFFFIHDDYWKAMIGPSCDCMHVYDWTFGRTKLGRFISHLYWSHSIRCKVKLPFKSLFFNRMYKQKFKEDKPLCFVYLGGNSIRYDDGWCEYIRRRDPRNRQVVLHGDLISKKIHWNYEELRNKMDLCITYDANEAKQYGIQLLDDLLCYSKPVPRDASGTYDYDVYYLAAVKDRYDEIMAAYQRLTELKARCCFLLAGVPEEKQIKREGITYITNISYEENVRYLNRSKCILEIKQGKSSGNITLRHLEAIAYQKRILTNSHVEGCNAYNDGQLLVFDTPEEIQADFVRSPMSGNDYPPVVDLDPIHRLYAIQELLDGAK